MPKHQQNGYTRNGVAIERKKLLRKSRGFLFSMG